MRQLFPKDFPDCVKRQFPRITLTHLSMWFVFCVAFGVIHEVYEIHSVGIRYAFVALFIVLFLWVLVLAVKGERGLKRLVRRAVDERFEMCGECGYPVPTGAEACPECGAAWDPDEAHKSWKSAERWLRLREHSDKKGRGASS